MKAFTKSKYGGPEILQLEEVERPSLKDGHILVKVEANSANPADWHILRGKPFFARFTFGLFKPKDKIPGADFAGIIEEVGSKVGHFNVGDRVFGDTLMGGAFAEYISIPANNCAMMRANSRSRLEDVSSATHRHRTHHHQRRMRPRRMHPLVD